MHPPFSFRLAEKKTGRAGPKEKALLVFVIGAVLDWGLLLGCAIPFQKREVHSRSCQLSTAFGVVVALSLLLFPLALPLCYRYLPGSAERSGERGKRSWSTQVLPDFVPAGSRGFDCKILQDCARASRAHYRKKQSLLQGPKSVFSLDRARPVSLFKKKRNGGCISPVPGFRDKKQCSRPKAFGTRAQSLRGATQIRGERPLWPPGYGEGAVGVSAPAPPLSFVQTNPGRSQLCVSLCGAGNWITAAASPRYAVVGMLRRWAGWWG